MSERALQAAVFDFLRVALPSDAICFCIPNGDGRMTTAPGISLKRIADHLNERVGPKDPTYHGLSLDELARGESYHPGDDA